jgi:uncharacterized phiE125 gp8 family phage protein
MGLIVQESLLQAVDQPTIVNHLRLGEAEAWEDAALLDRLIQAATAYVETETRTTLAIRSMILTRDRFPCEPVISLPRPPLKSVTSIQYLARSGETLTLPADAYVVDVSTRPGRIVLKPGNVWPATADHVNAIQIAFTAGYAANDLKPVLLQQAVMMLVGHWYANREATSDRRVNDVPMAVQSIIDQHRFWEVV